MPHPGREQRIQRHLAVLDLYDHIRAGGEIPQPFEVVELLNINEQDARNIRRNIAERCGRELPPTIHRHAPRPMPTPFGMIPPCPPKLSPMERCVWNALAASPGVPLMPSEVYMRAAATVASTAHDGRTVHCHVSRLRAKGARIVNTRGQGYWLVLEPLQEVAS